MVDTLTIINHPLIQDKLTRMRDVNTPPPIFRGLMRQVGALLAYEAMRDLPVGERSIETPLETGVFPCLDGPNICLASVLRAGNGLLDGALDIAPEAQVAHLGFYRDEETLRPVEYYFNRPPNIEARCVFVVDPMLATGHSAIAAVEKLKQVGAQQMSFLCLLASPEGAQAFAKAHPDVRIYTASLDRQLSDKGYILPGLGDAGDRLYGTIDI